MSFLPPADLMSKCLRCGAPMGDADLCPACGADPAIERQVYAQITPAVTQLRVVFAGIAVLSIVVGLVLYDHVRHEHGDAMRVLWPFAIGAAGFATLWGLAPRLPLGTALIGLALIGGNWLRVAADDPVGAFTPGIGLLINALVILTLALGVRSGITVHRLRRESRIPKATARAA